jgi:hypothetical protein
VAPDYASANAAGEARQVIDDGAKQVPLREWRMILWDID